MPYHLLAKVSQLTGELALSMTPLPFLLSSANRERFGFPSVCFGISAFSLFGIWIVTEDT